MLNKIISILVFLIEAIILTIQLITVGILIVCYVISLVVVIPYTIIKYREKVMSSVRGTL